MRSAPATSAARTLSPRQEKSAARIEGAIFASSALCGTELLLKGIYEFAVVAGNIFHCIIPCGPLCTPLYKRVPKARAAYGETDESWDPGSRRQPLVYLMAFSPRPRTMQPTLSGRLGALLARFVHNPSGNPSP